MSYKSRLIRARRETERFLEVVLAVTEDDVNDIAPNKRRAAAKRASMDLTRALADLRKPFYLE